MFVILQVYVVGFIVILTYLCGLIATSLFDTQLIPTGSTSTSNIEVNETKGWEPAYVFSHGMYRFTHSLLEQGHITVLHVF